MPRRRMGPLAQKWVRDGTLSGPGVHEIDLRSADSRHWITIQAADDESAEHIAAAVLAAVAGEDEVTLEACRCEPEQTTRTERR